MQSRQFTELMQPAVVAALSSQNATVCGDLFNRHCISFIHGVQHTVIIHGRRRADARPATVLYHPVSGIFSGILPATQLPSCYCYFVELEGLQISSWDLQSLPAHTCANYAMSVALQGFRFQLQAFHLLKSNYTYTLINSVACGLRGSMLHSQGLANNPILSGLNPIHRIDSYFFRIHCNIVLPPTPRPSLRSPFYRLNC